MAIEVPLDCRPLLIALVPNADEATAIREAVAGAYRLQIRRTPELFLDAIRCGIPNAVIVAASSWTAAEPGIAQSLRLGDAIRELFEDVPVIAYGTGHSTEYPAAMFGRSLSGSTCVIASASELRDSIASIVGNLRWPGLVEAFRTDLQLLTSDNARAFCTAALSVGGDASLYSRIVSATDRQRLARALRECGLRSERWFLARVRLLAAAQLLRARGRCMADVALALEFPTGDALRRALAREVGKWPSSISRTDLFRTIEAGLRAAIRGELVARRAPHWTEGRWQ